MMILTAVVLACVGQMSMWFAAWPEMGITEHWAEPMKQRETIAVSIDRRSMLMGGKLLDLRKGKGNEYGFYDTWTDEEHPVRTYSMTGTIDFDTGKVEYHNTSNEGSNRTVTTTGRVILVCKEINKN
jgi:hypothetical protein